ncbi:uncharacterized protein PV07_03623 [Cladophialophora immunda]|uniref:Heterokaryon incompatibility domain-containing protein n=1 Tax=Cladophialophora immunda TaxID=569365 RepID=A0A0D2CLK0_9EURO|nr:uncharacterized protein PV07_03623 [Cladophialophora immunda]KIW32048.1 hypothetical protein PV07_03623 [Cladophialophora immunda]
MSHEEAEQYTPSPDGQHRVLIFSLNDTGTSKPSIRLLDVLPRDGRSEIRCAIKHILLPASYKELRYTVLSYAQGDEKEPRYAISINNQPYEVLKNLYTFLDLHSLNGISNLFIDALYIAQNNIDEKNY